MFIKLTQKLQNKNKKRIDAAITKVGHKVVAVGFPLGTKGVSTMYPSGPKGGKAISVLETAVINNFGAKGTGKNHNIDIPQRDFMRAAIPIIIRDTSSLKKGLASAMLNMSMTEVKALKLLGAKAAASVQEAIVALDTPPNAESTIRKKKSSNPLIDTSLMVQSVTFAVR